MCFPSLFFQPAVEQRGLVRYKRRTNDATRVFQCCLVDQQQKDQGHNEQARPALGFVLLVARSTTKTQELRADDYSRITASEVVCLRAARPAALGKSGNGNETHTRARAGRDRGTAPVFSVSCAVGCGSHRHVVCCRVPRSNDCTCVVSSLRV